MVFKFSFVRNPTRRIVSAFNNFFVDFKNKQHRRHLPYIEKFGFNTSRDNEYNFDIFLNYLTRSFEGDMDRIDPHFRPQFYNVRPDLLSYDFLGRVENLDRDMATITHRLKDRGVDLKMQPIERKNVSKGGYSPTASQIKRLEDLFCRDFELFE
ncbi:sulfotransferase family 2 domain-containing protein [Phaeovulum sp.]|uniref:sulfotransferase family 2 domain-containing protein n=1 Tax=Phaeovulum sp. TaxID=2934796 RepID=UPI0039E58514